MQWGERLVLKSLSRTGPAVTKRVRENTCNFKLTDIYMNMKVCIILFKIIFAFHVFNQSVDLIYSGVILL